MTFLAEGGAVFAPGSQATTIAKRQKIGRITAGLKADRESFISHWRELNDYISPRRARFLISDVNKGERRSTKIVDSTATFAARTLQSGMMAGVTSPARPWFRLTVPQPELRESAAVKAYLYDVEDGMRTVFTRSNLYNVLPSLYADMGVFGTAAMAVMEDDEDVIRCTSFPIGSYMLGQDSKGRVRLFIREFRMTVRQIVERFGRTVPKAVIRLMEDGSGAPTAAPGETIDWSRISASVRSQWTNDNRETWIDVAHIIMPNDEYNDRKAGAQYKPFTSCYFESGVDEGKLLEEGGFDEFPILAPRWETTGEDVYGTNSPGIATLGDIKQLQLMEKRKAQAIEKMINPPMNAPMAMRNFAATILPGGINYGDAPANQGFRPVYQLQFDIAPLMEDENLIRFRISRGFFEDLFLMLASSDRREITAREVEERHEEKLLALGSMLENLNQDCLDPLIDRVFAIMNRRGLLPEPPEELEGTALRVEYISIMAQAQKMVGLGALERFAGFVGEMAKTDPSVLDKVDRDQMVDEYAEMTGVSPQVVVPDEDVAMIRQQRAEAAQARERTALAAQEAQAAQTLSETDTTKPSALTDLLDAARAGPIPAVAA